MKIRRIPERRVLIAREVGLDARLGTAAELEDGSSSESISNMGKEVLEEDAAVACCEKRRIIPGVARPLRFSVCMWRDVRSFCRIAFRIVVDGTLISSGCSHPLEKPAGKPNKWLRS